MVNGDISRGLHRNPMGKAIGMEILNVSLARTGTENGNEYNGGLQELRIHSSIPN